MMIELLWILSLVEGEMKEISEAEMLKRLNLLTNTSKNQISLNCVYKLLLKERSSKDGEKTKRFTLK
jgi:hypothetical protein